MTAPGDPLLGKAALDAVASPPRLELLSALGDGPATTLELAGRLGRSRQSLYYHLRVLERAGLVSVDPPDEGSRERRFRLREGRIAVAAARGSSQDLAAAEKALRAVLRLTAREASDALADPETRFHSALREMIGFRGKVRLSEAKLERANQLIDELERLFRPAKGGSTDLPLYALTLVLTPAREAGGTAADPQEGP